MKTVYRFDDGQEFDDIEKARDYDKKLKEEQIAKEKLEQRTKELYSIVQVKVNELNKAIDNYEKETGNLISISNKPLGSFNIPKNDWYSKLINDLHDCGVI